MLFPVDRLNGGAYNVDASANQFFYLSTRSMRHQNSLQYLTRGITHGYWANQLLLKFLFWSAHYFYAKSLQQRKWKMKKKLEKKEKIMVKVPLYWRRCQSTAWTAAPATPTLLPKKLRWLLKIKVPSKGKALDTRSQENVQKALVET